MKEVLYVETLWFVHFLLFFDFYAINFDQIFNGRLTKQISQQWKIILPGVIWRMISATKNLLQIQRKRGSLKMKEKKNKTHNKINQTGKPKERQTLGPSSKQSIKHLKHNSLRVKNIAK